MSRKHSSQMSFLDHLEELRWHIIRSFVAVFVMAILAFIFKEFVLSANKLGFEVAESNPELELNNRVQSMWDGLEVEQHKKRRAYIKEL